MGSCCTAQNETNEYACNLLMLGTGSSGKSTIFKQLQYIYGNGYDMLHPMDVIGPIKLQIIDSIKCLIENCQEYFSDNPDMYPQLNLAGDTNYNDEIQQAIDYFIHKRHEPEYMDKQEIEYMKMVWNYDPIQEMFKLRHKICIPDSLEYFMNKVDEIFKNDYLPSREDVILLDARTIGILEKYCEYKLNKFKVMDTGGQRCDRNKWTDVRNDINAAIFVVSLACYDEIIFEAEANGIVESLNCFNKQINSEYFQDTPFFLIFTKIDVFQQKIKKVPITVAPCFKDFNGNPNDYESVKEMIVQSFKDQIQNNSPDIHVRFVNGTDQSSVETVFNDILTFLTQN